MDVIKGTTIYSSLEYKITDLMSDYLFKKEFKKTIKKLAIIDGGEVIVFQLKHTEYLSNQNRFQNELKTSYPNCIVLNDLLTEEAFEAYKNAMTSDIQD